MSVKVSVVVAVYNTGKYIDVCIDSILGQSLPSAEYEAIFVDDGSTDDTPARLDRLAAEHANIHVIHIPGSGGPGKPRNVGIDAAVGEFVQFVDDDDWLGPEALHRMYEYGAANDADVVVGKIAGQGRAVPRELFRVNRPHANVDNAPLMDSLTPHKMFRRSFLNEHALRYPEGARRLEDHGLVAAAYLLARNVSVLSDYTCYYHTRRDDSSNSSLALLEPVGYFVRLREALDVVDSLTEPGVRRDKMHRRWLRNEMVERLRGRRFLNKPADHQALLFDEIRKVVVERFAPGVAAGLPPMQQIISAMVVANRFDDVVALARWESTISAQARLDDLGWSDGALTITIEADLYVDGAAMSFRREGGVEYINPPLSAAGREAAGGRGAAVPKNRVKADVVLVHRASSVEYFLPAVHEPAYTGPDDDVRLTVRTTATLNPLTAALGEPLADGVWDVRVRVSSNGWTKETRLNQPAAAPAPTGAVIGTPPRLVLPGWIGPHAALAIDIDHQTSKMADDLALMTPECGRVVDGALHVTLPFHVPAPTEISVRFIGSSWRRPDSRTGVLDSGGVLTVVDLPQPQRSRPIARNRIDVAFPIVVASEVVASKQEFASLGVALDPSGRGLAAASRIWRGRSTPRPRPTGATVTSRYTPRRVLAALRRRAAGIKRRLLP